MQPLQRNNVSINNWLIHSVRNCGVCGSAQRARPPEGPTGGPKAHCHRFHGRPLKARAIPIAPVQNRATQRGGEARAGAKRGKKPAMRSWWHATGATHGPKYPSSHPTWQQLCTRSRSPTRHQSTHLLYLPNPRDMVNIQDHSVTWTASTRGHQLRFLLTGGAPLLTATPPSWQSPLSIVAATPPSMAP